MIDKKRRDLIHRITSLVSYVFLTTINELFTRWGCQIHLSIAKSSKHFSTPLDPQVGPGPPTVSAVPIQ
jgi:hypothetical protein